MKPARPKLAFPVVLAGLVACSPRDDGINSRVWTIAYWQHLVRAGLVEPNPAVEPVPARASAHQMLPRSEEHTSELQSQSNLVCRLLLEKKKKRYEREFQTWHHLQLGV